MSPRVARQPTNFSARNLTLTLTTMTSWAAVMTCRRIAVRAASTSTDSEQVSLAVDIHLILSRQINNIARTSPDKNNIIMPNRLHDRMSPCTIWKWGCLWHLALFHTEVNAVPPTSLVFNLARCIFELESDHYWFEMFASLCSRLRHSRRTTIDIVKSLITGSSYIRAIVVVRESWDSSIAGGGV